MKLNDFNYELPDELIAQHPVENRDDSRMIIINRNRNEVRETRFLNFARYVKEGDLIVINETMVVPARLYGVKDTGARIEIFLTRRLGNNMWRCLCRPSKRLKTKDRIYIGEARNAVTIEEEIGDGEWIVSLPDRFTNTEFMKTFGQVPLPPYIRREVEEADVERYQTIYARTEGSVAAPTAGLHFTDRVFRDIEHKGSTVLPVTLHVGSGTFRPLENETVEDNILASEYVMIRKDYWDEILDAKKTGRSVIAVGTTTTRVLEALAIGNLKEKEIKVIDHVEYITGWTNLFIYPGFKFRIIDSLLTNLHLPMSSLYILVSAFAGREEVRRTYKWAVQRRFRFYSYGDVMFIR